MTTIINNCDLVMMSGRLVFGRKAFFVVLALRLYLLIEFSGNNCIIDVFVALVQSKSNGEDRRCPISQMKCRSV